MKLEVWNRAGLPLSRPVLNAATAPLPPPPWSVECPLLGDAILWVMAVPSWKVPSHGVCGSPYGVSFSGSCPLFGVPFMWEVSY